MSEGARTPLLAVVLSLVALAVPMLSGAGSTSGKAQSVATAAAPARPQVREARRSEPPQEAGKACMETACEGGSAACRMTDGCEGRFFAFLSRRIPAPTDSAPPPTDDAPPCARFVPESTVHVVAMLPDPLDTGMRASFDDGLDALLRALETQGYCREAFWSPWHDASPRRDGDDGAAECSAKVPAVFTFRDCLEAGMRPPVNLFVVGESPTSGVRAGAIRLALSLARSTRPKHLALIGPTFSGSVDSLDAAMGATSPDGVRLEYTVATGSASIQRVREKLASRGDTDYRAYVLSSEAVRQGFFSYLLTTNLVGTARLVEPVGSRPRRWLEHVALFTEEGTSFGNTIQTTVSTAQAPAEKARASIASPARASPARASTDRAPTAASAPGPCTTTAPCDASINVKFPLHVSSIRSSFSSELAPAPQPVETIGPVAPRQLELKLRVDTGERRDTPPALSQQTGIAEDLTLAEQTRVLEEENVRVVGIFASDPVDALFLVRRLRERLPNARLFVFEHDALFQHPDNQADLRGVVLVSSYPLTARMDRWVFPFRESDRRLFTSPYGTALYNAALLGTSRSLSVGFPREDFTLGYGAPFVVPDDGAGVTPALWFSAMGTAGAMPLAAIPEVADAYTTPLIRSKTSRNPDEIASLGANVFPGPGFRAGVTLILAALLVLSLGAQQGMTSPAGLFLGLRWGSVFRPPLLLPTDTRRVWTSAASTTIAAYCAATVLIGALLQPLAFVSLPPNVVIHLPRMDALAWVHAALLFVILGLTLRSEYEIVRESLGFRWAGAIAIVFGVLLASVPSVVLSRRALSDWAQSEPANFAFTYARWTSLGTQLSPVPPVLLLLGVFALLGFQYLTEAQAGARHSMASVRKVFDFTPLEVSGRKPALFGVGGLGQLQDILLYNGLISRTPAFLVGAGVAALFILVSMGDGLGGFDTLESSGISWTLAVLLAGAQIVTAGAIGRMLAFVSAAILLLSRLRLHPLADRVVLKQSSLSVDTDLAFARLPSTSELLRVWLEHSARLAAALPDGDEWRATKKPEHPDRMRIAALQGDLVAGLAEGLADRPALPASLLTALRNGWDPVSGEPAENEPARDLAAVYVLLFVYWMIRVFRLKVAFPMVSSLLVTLAVAVYPFQPARDLATLAAVFFVITLVMSFSAFIALERDPFLERLAGGAQNKVQWTWSLARHIGSWVILPLLAFLATQYPDKARDLFTWIKPIVGGG